MSSKRLIKRCKLEMYPNAKKQLRSQHSQRGVGLPAAIFIITVLALITVAMTGLQENNGLSLGVNVNSQRAFFAAESGGQIALNKVFPPSGVGATTCSATLSTIYTGTFNSTGLNGCSTTATCISDTVGTQNYYTFTSTGSCGSGIDASTRVIEVRARQ